MPPTPTTRSGASSARCSPTCSPCPPTGSACSTPHPRPYARLLHEHLTAAGIRHNGSGSRPTVERSIPQGIIRLLDALNRDLPRADLFEALSAARITLADGGAAPVNRWERISRLAGVVSGDDWDHRLDQYAERERLRAAEERGERTRRESRLAAIETNIELGQQPPPVRPRSCGRQAHEPQRADRGST